MKKLLLILLVFFYLQGYSQIFSPLGSRWKYIPKIQTDSLQALRYFTLNGDTIKITSSSDGQVLKRVNGIWINSSVASFSYDSLHFDSSTGILHAYKDGYSSVSDTLDGRYPIRQEMIDSINSISLTKAAYDTLAIGGQIVNQDSIQTLYRKTLITPTIASFYNATHDHSDSIHGGLLSDIYVNVFGITLPSSTTVAGRCSGATEGTDYPTGWTINADGVSPYNLVVHHGLHRHIASVSVFTVNGNIERQLFANAAYSGIVASNDSTLTIESLATIQTTIAINLIFK